ncbi:hypothetical protein GCM10011494_17860 [Novosphingobium endophyticum]|uniref:Ankyrin repeat domain-containing protein n=1 Tax=Novosphingobium endophyticum TaxID=1955250 RepID=A0A916TRW5_9SPHN|nr:hypothetical protein GCM10011494_17860 [Novosphingobium endophyticum]
MRESLPLRRGCAKGASLPVRQLGDALVYRTFAVSILTLALLGTAACDPRWDKGEKALQETPDSDQVCRDPLSDPEVLREQRLVDEALRKALLADDPDPVAEAGKALEAGDFRLAGALTAGGVSTSIYGAQCRMRGGVASRTVRVVAFIDETAADKPGPEHLARAEKFARGYNAAVLADERYPYADVCRPFEGEVDLAPPVEEERKEPLWSDRPFGFADLDPLPPSPTLAEVVRRGSVARLDRMLRTGKYDVNAPDLFGMTPLAWAIAYRRRGSADLLLRADANPNGAACQTIFDRYSPMQVARAQQWIGMLRRMQPLVSEDDFNSLQELPRLSAGDIDRFNQGLDDLNKRFEEQFRGNRYLTKHRIYFTVDAQGNATACRIEPSTTYEDYDKQICELGLEELNWKPARGVFGNVIAGESSLFVGVRTR